MLQKGTKSHDISPKLIHNGRTVSDLDNLGEDNRNWEKTTTRLKTNRSKKWTQLKLREEKFGRNGERERMNHAKIENEHDWNRGEKIQKEKREENCEES